MTMTLTMASTCMGLAAAWGQHDMVLLSLLITRYNDRCFGLATVPQYQTPSQELSQAYSYDAIVLLR